MHELDIKYRSISHESDLVVKDEMARRLRVRGVLARDEVDMLRDQMSRKDDKIASLSDKADKIRGQLNAATQKSKQQEKQLRLQTREIANFKVNIPCLVEETSKTYQI